MFKNWKNIFLISLLMLLMSGFNGCKNSPTSPDAPREYRDQVKVIYTRDPAKIRSPQAADIAILHYELFDPDTKEPINGEDEYIEGNYRIGAAIMEKVAENKFRGYLKHVFIQDSPHQPKHMVYIDDPKLYNGIDSFTPYGITIQGAYDIEIKGHELYFRMSKK